MYFDFEGRNFETPTVESAVSWREQLLVSLFGHIAAVVLILVVPSLSFVQSAEERREERRAERLAELAELQQQAPLQDSEDRTFVFVAPRADLEADAAPRPDAFFSDRDRIAQSPLQDPEAENQLPMAEGNSFEFVEPDEPSAELALDGDLTMEEEAENPDEDLRAEAPDDPLDSRLAEAASGQGEEESTDVRSDDPGATADDRPGTGTRADSSLTTPGSGPGDPREADSRKIARAEELLGQARESLRRSLNLQTFGNVSGDTGRYGPEIQFDTKGADFGPWIRRFVAQIRRNWIFPYSVLSNHGHVVLTFNVHRDGSVTDLAVVKPARIDSFNRSAQNALRMSNPTQPLPDDYPDNQVFFTVTFFFNEIPPGRTY
jgi:TonB family protein